MGVFPQFVFSSSPLETALNVHNVPLHCAIIYANLQEIVKGRLKFFYRDGLDESAADIMEAVDCERGAICSAYSVGFISLNLETLCQPISLFSAVKGISFVSNLYLIGTLR